MLTTTTSTTTTTTTTTMPFLPQNFSSSIQRWIGIFMGRIDRHHYYSRHHHDCSASECTDGPISTNIECYACTQSGLPAFHSTTYDGAHQPEWEATAGSSLIPISKKPGLIYSGTTHSKPHHWPPRGPFGPVMDPRSKRVKRWNRALLIARGMALAIDSLFFYVISIGRGDGGTPCLYMDGDLAATVAVLRTCVDLVHVFHIWLQFRLAYVSRESMVIGCGKLVWDPRAIACHYVRSLKGFWFDVFVILPVPQVVFWLAVPKMMQENQMKQIMTLLLLVFLFQYLPKVYHSLCMMRRMRKVTGYIFGTIWWGFGLNLIAYFIASHVAGGCWYVLAMQRVVSCLQQYCSKREKCNMSLSCSKVLSYQFLSAASGNQSRGNSSASSLSLCLDVDGPYNYGIYGTALPVISSDFLSVRILYPIFWGLLNLSTFANELAPTSNLLEVTFSIIIVLSGLMLFTLLIGNIQVFLHAVMAKKKKMQLRFKEIEWWMRRRQLPSSLRQRVCDFEYKRLAHMAGADEMELIKDLPDGLRRDIKRFLCLDLIKEVPLFQDLDDLILDNICDRVKRLIFSKDEKIIREGDPVHRMVFIVRGLIRRNQSLSKGNVAINVLGPGSFFGDELLSWCLRRPFLERLPASTATFVCAENTEAFALEAHHLRFVTEHFRYKFKDERLKRTARYYSSNWRTWAAVKVQFAWRRYVARTRGQVMPVVGNGDSAEHKLRQIAAMFMSLRPHDHLE